MKISNDTRPKRITLLLMLSALLVMFSLTATVWADTGDTDVQFSSHTSSGTYTYPIGHQLYVSAIFKNSDLKPNLRCYIGVYNLDTAKYVEKSYLGTLRVAQQEYAAKIDTSGLAISTGKYRVVAFIYDATPGVESIDVKDTFNLNIKAIGTPVISSAKSTGASSVKVSWSALKYINGYKVYKATSPSGTYSYVDKTRSTSFNCTGLKTGTTYYFKVKAYCSGGATTKYSHYSTYKSCKPMPAAPEISAVSTSYASIKISWNTIPEASGYQVYRSTNATGTYSLVKTVTGGSSYSWTNTGLTTGKTYYYKVRSMHTELYGTSYMDLHTKIYYSSLCSFKSAKPMPSSPSIALALNTNNTDIRIAWHAIAGANGYQIYRAASRYGTYTRMATVTGTTTKWTDTGIPAGQVYYYKVRTYHIQSGVRLYSAFSSVKYQGTLSVPTVKINPGPDGASIVLSWSTCTEAEENGGYEVYRVDPSTGSVLINDSDKFTNSFTDTGLNQFTSYTYKVRSFCEEGSTIVYSSFSQPVTTATSVVLAEPMLTLDGLVYDNTGATPVPGVQIHWSAVENAQGYVIERRNLSTENDYHWLATVPPDSVTHTDWGIDDANGNYAYRVYAYYGTLDTSDYVYGMLSNNVYFYAYYYH